jgi:hypothetical protein
MFGTTFPKLRLDGLPIPNQENGSDRHDSSFKREGSPYPGSTQATQRFVNLEQSRRRFLQQRSFSNGSDEDEGFDDELLAMNGYQQQGQDYPRAVPNNSLEGMVQPLLPGLEIPGLVLPGPCCCERNPDFKPRFGNFLAPPDMFGHLISSAISQPEPGHQSEAGNVENIYNRSPSPFG